ncbi:MAG: restriction endonuclease, partial [Selenomonadaceae bacterium]|nr:restriction endonuclease [Selenomonadaceae bacterium]
NSYTIGTNSFTEMDEYFFSDKPTDGEEYVQILGLENKKRVFRWIQRNYVNNPEPLEKFKVFLPSSNGSGAIGEVLSTPLVGLPLVGCTETFITVGAFDSEVEARACLAYIKSKFCRAMLGVLKVTQHNTAETWAKVPLQDFSAASDIDWTKKISEIDAQLYKKYSLSAEEIKFIEEKVRAME